MLKFLYYVVFFKKANKIHIKTHATYYKTKTFHEDHYIFYLCIKNLAISNVIFRDIEGVVDRYFPL